MSEQRWAYDLDGVLAQAPPAHVKPWRHMTGPERVEHRARVRQHYVSARGLYRPQQQAFLVVTARSRDAEEVTRRWLAVQFPGRQIRLHVFDGARTIANVVAYKAAVLVREQPTDYAEDNRSVVRELRKKVPLTRIWHYKDGCMNLDYKDAPL